MSQSDMHLLFQQMGEVLSGIRSVHDTIAIRQAQAEQLHDLVRSDLATLRRDQRDVEEKLDYMMCMAKSDIDVLRSSSNENTCSIGALVEGLEALRRPIIEIVALKSRLAGLLLAASILGSGVLWLAEPVYRWFIDFNLQRH